MTETIIELRDLSIGYGNKKVLQNINAKINKGEIVGIIGCNGAGKKYTAENDPRFAVKAKR